MRMGCSVPGLEHNWIDINERWTRDEAIALGKLLDAQGPGREYFLLLQEKSHTCNIELEDGSVITDPDDLHHEIGNIDLALWGWLQNVLIASIGHRTALGKVSALPLSDRSGQLAAQKQ